MRARVGVVAVGALLASVAGGHAAARLTAAEVQATFFTGQPFTASTPSGVKFKMVFTPDGRVSREPIAKAGSKTGAKGEGTWKLDQQGFCTAWKGQKPNCYSVVANGHNKWSIMKASSLMAIWSK
jgi:hypothetical protein